MCGVVPPRVFKSESCRHAFCSLCEVHAQPNCPFDYTAWRRSTTDDAALELVSRASVFCWNRGERCKYSGSLSELPFHFRQCPYYRTQCGMCGPEGLDERLDFARQPLLSLLKRSRNKHPLPQLPAQQFQNRKLVMRWWNAMVDYLFSIY
ncbi:hypothetical protein MTO96_052126 [Rhipicephalus appendiculatus]